MNEIRASWWATGVFAVSAVAGVTVKALRWPAIVVALALFALGVALMAATLVIGAGRSRTETLDIGGLFFSQAPTPLKLSLVVQVVVAFATAAVRPTAAFGVLAPIAGLGLCGLWGARHGTFPERPTAT